MGENITVSVNGLAYLILLVQDTLHCMLLANPSETRSLTGEVFEALGLDRAVPLKMSTEFFAKGAGHA